MLRQAGTTGIFMAAALGVMIGRGYAADRHDPRAVALSVKVKADQIRRQAGTVFAHVAPGRLIAQKAGEVSSYADYFLAPPPYCDHVTVRTYIREMKETVDDMERLARQLRRRPIHVRRSVVQLGAVTVVLEDGRNGWCGGCGHCLCCNSVRQLKEEIECLEDLVRRLDRATLRCPVCGRLRVYENRVLAPASGPVIVTPGTVVVPPPAGPGFFPGPPLGGRPWFEEHERYEEHEERWEHGEHRERHHRHERQHEGVGPGPRFPGHVRIDEVERWQQLAGFVLSLALE